MAQAIVNHEQSLQLVALPDELLVHIFGFLDSNDLGAVVSVCQLFERLQQTDLLWQGLFPQIKSLDPHLPVKKRVLFLLTPIPLGNKKDQNQCVLNLYRNTITQVPDFFWLDEVCLTAISHPHVPNGSFAVYAWTDNLYAAVIKSKDGTVGVVRNLEREVQEQGPHYLAIDELRKHEGTSSPFREYKLIPDKNDKHYHFCHFNFWGNIHICERTSSRLTVASDYLRGKKPNLETVNRLGSHGFFENFWQIFF